MSSLLRALPATDLQHLQHLSGNRRRLSVASTCTFHEGAIDARFAPPENRGWMNYYGRFCRSMLHPLLKRINGYLVRWARKKYRRLASFKRVKRWWDGLLARNRPMFAHWQWTGTFQWLR